jgi:hypothetical protein
LPLKISANTAFNFLVLTDMRSFVDRSTDESVERGSDVGCYPVEIIVAASLAFEIGVFCGQNIVVAVCFYAFFVCKVDIQHTDSSVLRWLKFKFYRNTAFQDRYFKNYPY